MFVQTEPTPNPATLKFLPGQEVMKEGTIFFQNEESASNSPLAIPSGFVHHPDACSQSRGATWPPENPTQCVAPRP